MNTRLNETPETSTDINQNLFIFLHLDEPGIYQLLHNETDKEGINKFQIYGRVRGEKIKVDKKKKFLFEEMDLKLINIVQGKGKEMYKIANAKIGYNPAKDQIDFFILIEPVSEQNHGIDYVLKQLFVVEKNQKIDYHVDTNPPLITRNGRPCNNRAYF